MPPILDPTTRVVPYRLQAFGTRSVIHDFFWDDAHMRCPIDKVGAYASGPYISDEPDGRLLSVRYAATFVSGASLVSLGQEDFCCQLLGLGLRVTFTPMGPADPNVSPYVTSGLRYRVGFERAKRGNGGA